MDMLWNTGTLPCTGRVEAVNPWELEVDPDFERTEDEIKRDQEAEQRALRAAAIAMRRYGTPQLAVYIMHGRVVWVLGVWEHGAVAHRAGLSTVCHSAAVRW